MSLGFSTLENLFVRATLQHSDTDDTPTPRGRNNNRTRHTVHGGGRRTRVTKLKPREFLCVFSFSFGRRYFWARGRFGDRTSRWKNVQNVMFYLPITSLLQTYFVSCKTIVDFRNNTYWLLKWKLNTLISSKHN